jgi:hypothetical protein
MLWSNMAMTTRTTDLVEQVLDAIDRTINRKGFAQHLPVSITEHDKMVLFGEIYWNAHDLFVVAGSLE